MPSLDWAAPADFDASLPTHLLHREAPRRAAQRGPYAQLRASLDTAHHGVYTAARQRLQDELLRRTVHGGGAPAGARPCIIFTAGAMGAGKSHALRWLASQGVLALDDFVRVDVDGFREQLPEWPLYLSTAGSDAAGALTQRESGYLAEMAQELALNLGRSVLVDGSLRDVEWFRGVFADIRARYPHYRIAILHVTASWETVKARAASRAAAVGRAVPQEQLWEAFDTVPTSVAHLAPYADMAVEICNETEATVVRLVTDGLPVPGPSWELLDALTAWLDQEELSETDAWWFDEPDEPEACWAAVGPAHKPLLAEQGFSRLRHCFKASDAFPTAAKATGHRRWILWSGGWMRAGACA